jgi:S-adenosylmethionine hydrolase
MRPWVTLLTDFGTADGYVAAMQARILQVTPAAGFVHITHEVPPQNVEAGGFLLARVCPEFPVGTVHLAVVDPGVGSERRAVLVEVEGHTFVGPDNGLFARVTQGRAIRAYEIDPRRCGVGGPPSPTFHGRDVFAPAAAQLLAGRRPEDLGDPVPSLLPGRTRAWRAVDFAIEATVVWVDRFGTCITDVPADRLPARPRVQAAGWETVGLTRTYAEAPAGSAIALVGSGGTLEIAVSQGRADEVLGLQLGDRVRVEAEHGGPW